MPERLAILGQIRPTGAGAAVEAYRVPTDTQAVVSSIIVANTTGAETTFRIHAGLAPANGVVGNALFYDVPVAARSSVVLTLGATLAAGFGITVSAAAANAVTFTIFGQEVTA